MKEFCICAAIKASIRSKDGLIIRGHRHCDCYHNLSLRPEYKEIVLRERQEEGFITSKNRFVDRKEGLKLQLEAGIISQDKGGYRNGELFSEDLY